MEKREIRGTETLKDNDTTYFEVLFCCAHHGSCPPCKTDNKHTASDGLHPVPGEAGAKRAISALHTMLKEKETGGRGRLDRIGPWIALICRTDVTVMEEEGM